MEQFQRYALRQDSNGMHCFQRNAMAGAPAMGDVCVCVCVRVRVLLTWSSLVLLWCCSISNDVAYRGAGVWSDVPHETFRFVHIVLAWFTAL
jgi:hypothetical protein